MQVVLSEAILRSIRHQASILVPPAKSAHVAEALAAGFGFASNAALRAALASEPRQSTQLHSPDDSAFATRLRTLSGIGSAPGILSRAVLASHAAADGPGYADLIDAQTFASESLRLFSQGAWRFNWRMGHTPIGIMDFVENHSEQDGDRFAPVLALGIATHAAVDPEVAGFLSEWMQDAIASRGKPDAQDSNRWGDFVYWALEPRIRAFLDKACRRWDGAMRLEDLPRKNRAARRASGPIAYPSAKVSVSGEGVTPLECGRVDIDGTTTLIGMATFAMYLEGVPKEQLNAFVGRCEPVGGDWDRVRSVVTAWVDANVPRSSDRPDPVRDATREPTTAWGRIVAMGLDEGSGDIHVEIDAERHPALYRARILDTENGRSREIASGMASDLDLDRLDAVSASFEGTIAFAEVPGSFDLVVRVHDAAGARKRAFANAEGKDTGAVLSEGVLFPMGPRAGQAVSRALEAQGLQGSIIGSDADLGLALMVAYRMADHVLLDVSKRAGLREDELDTIARGILGGVVHVIVGASMADRSAILDRLSPGTVPGV